jgi:hypothetical protein
MLVGGVLILDILILFLDKISRFRDLSPLSIKKIHLLMGCLVFIFNHGRRKKYQKGEKRA